MLVCDLSKYFEDFHSVKMLLSQFVVMYMLGILLGLGLAELPIGICKLNGLTIPCIWPVQFLLYATISAVQSPSMSMMSDSTLLHVLVAKIGGFYIRCSGFKITL